MTTNELDLKRRLKIESRMSEQDIKEMKSLETNTNNESEYKLIKQLEIKQQFYVKISMFISITIGIVTFLLHNYGWQLQLLQLWVTPQLLLFLFYQDQKLKLGTKLNNNEFMQSLYSKFEKNKTLILLLKSAQFISNSIEILWLILKGVLISLFENNIIKKIIDDQEQWFEEIIEIYEEIVYDYETDPDELSIGKQMDLDDLIENYDLSEDCFEELISVYESYDDDGEEDQLPLVVDNQKNDQEDFKVQNLGEEEYIPINNNDDIIIISEEFDSNKISPKKQKENNKKKQNKKTIKKVKKPKNKQKKQKKNKKSQVIIAIEIQ